MNSNTGKKDVKPSDGEQMQELRKLVLGENNQVIRDVVEEEARKSVASVLTEALHDRQKSDGSVSAVLTPLVEKSVEASVVARKEQFVSYLYPLVGSLVRKSVSSFLAELIEQTNEMLESSLTYKGLRWRFEARKAGISYSQYVVQQTFVFRVEQVLLIHRETGLLLRTIVLDKTQATDGDMFSAMLTAINDFVADSFSKQHEGSEQSLDEIKTDDFTLLIKQGPKAFLVAAITGNPPANIADKLQQALENIHQIYNDELNSFDGDAVVFENTDQQLNGCLLTQQKEVEVTKKKIPWLTIIPLLISIVVLGYFITKHWQLNNVVENIQALPDEPGIVLLNVASCEDKICVDVLRDPFAEDTMSWIVGEGGSEDLIQINERAYRSLDPKLLTKRIFNLQKDFPELSYNVTESKFYGVVNVEQFTILKARLTSMPDTISVQDLLSGITISPQEVSSDLLNRFMLEKELTAITSTTLDFNVNGNELSESALSVVKRLSEKTIKAANFAKNLNETFSLVIMGTSTKGGSESYNQQLSLERAETVYWALINNGVMPEILKITGLGALDSNDAEPRAIFHVIRLQSEKIKKVQN
ncbi:MAG: OmpA family protein [Marinomonas colpomeniae]